MTGRAIATWAVWTASWLALAGVAHASDELKVHFLPVGSGNCILVECPGEDAVPMLVDCGHAWPTHGAPRQVKAFLKERLPPGSHLNVVITHPHVDHFNFVANVLRPLKSLTIDNVWFGGMRTGADQANLGRKVRHRAWRFRRINVSRWQDKILRLGNKKPETHDPGAGPMKPSRKNLSCGDANLRILANNTPPRGGGKKKKKEPNLASLVLYIEYNGFVVVLPGDAEGQTELAALEAYKAEFNKPLHVNLLAASHHGSQTHNSNSSLWARTTQPDLVVYNTGQFYGHPRCCAMTRYRNYGLTKPVPKHDFRCYTTGFWVWRPCASVAETRRAEFTTASSGRVSVSTTGGTNVKVEWGPLDGRHRATWDVLQRKPKSARLKPDRGACD